MSTSHLRHHPQTAVTPSPSPASWGFHVFGQAAPQGSKSPKGRTAQGHVILVESSARVGPWRQAVSAAGLGAGPCLDGPLAVAMIFTVSRPKTARRADRVPCRMPDVSKLARAVEDAVTDAGLWADDARVALYEPLAKAYVGCPYAGVGETMLLPVPGVIVACLALEGTGGSDYRAELAALVARESARAHARRDRWRAEVV